MAMLDLIAVIIEVEPLSQIQVKATGEMRDKRTITLSDDSGISIKGTIWGEEAARADISVGTILACKNAKVSDYGGKSLNFSGNMVANPVNEDRY